ncbi:hypothetical protein ACF3NA_02150 [Alkanindiges sp. WGS2144]|uniref:hypothetical protein n=1 Tax=Alkanindiges sp. WGS2144 TaxID=3366808 RepID=UPI00375080A2
MRHFIHHKSARWFKKHQLERLQSHPSEQRLRSTVNRLKFALFAGIFGLLLGGLFDLATILLRTLAQPQVSAEFIWFLAYVFAAIGAVTGFCFGSRAGELFAQLFAGDDQGASAGSSALIRLIAKTLLVVGIIWSLFLIFLS